MNELIEGLKAEVAKAKAAAEAVEVTARVSQDATDALWQEYFPLSAKYQALASVLTTLERTLAEAPAGDAP